jgi:hypothetical protein
MYRLEFQNCAAFANEVGFSRSHEMEKWSPPIPDC